LDSASMAFSSYENACGGILYREQDIVLKASIEYMKGNKATAKAILVDGMGKTSGNNTLRLASMMIGTNSVKDSSIATAIKRDSVLSKDPAMQPFLPRRDFSNIDWNAPPGETIENIARQWNKEKSIGPSNIVRTHNVYVVLNEDSANGPAKGIELGKPLEDSLKVQLKPALIGGQQVFLGNSNDNRYCFFTDPNGVLRYWGYVFEY